MHIFYLIFQQFEYLVNKLLKNNYVDPSSTVLSLIVRKSYQDNGPLQAFETIKSILIEWNNLVGMFPIIRKLLRDDCTEELKQVKIIVCSREKVGATHVWFVVFRRLHLELSRAMKIQPMLNLEYLVSF